MVEQLLQIRWWDWSDERIAENVPMLCDASVDRFVGVHGGADAGGTD